MSERESEKMSSSESDLSLGDPNELFVDETGGFIKKVDNWAEEVAEKDERRMKRVHHGDDIHHPPNWKAFISPKMVSIDDRSIVHLAEGNPWKTEPGRLLETYSPKKSEPEPQIKRMRMGNFNLTRENFPKMGEQTSERNSEPKMTIMRHEYTRDYVPARPIEQTHWSESLNHRRERVRELQSVMNNTRPRTRRRTRPRERIRDKERSDNGSANANANANVEDGWTVVTKGRQKAPSPPLSVKDREPEPEPEPVIVHPEPEVKEEIHPVDDSSEVLEIISKKKKTKKRKVSIDLHDQEVTKYSRIIRYYQIGMGILAMLFLILLSVRI